jgi:hypothetical protein
VALVVPVEGLLSTDRGDGGVSFFNRSDPIGPRIFGRTGLVATGVDVVVSVVLVALGVTGGSPVSVFTSLRGWLSAGSVSCLGAGSTTAG